MVSSAQVSASPTPGLGNLQSVVGSGMGNAITTSSVVTMSSHSPLTTALQSGNSNTQSSSNTIGTQVKSASTTATTSTAMVPHEIQAQVITLLYARKWAQHPLWIQNCFSPELELVHDGQGFSNIHENLAAATSKHPPKNCP